jgi:SAM-dependent methyltransferase
MLTTSENTVSTFYGTFPYPWRPMYFDVMSEPSFYATMLRQETGRVDLPDIRSIWVAGCGTNQALITALRYPEAAVLGTDVSAESLEICRANAAKVGVSNLRLEQRGLLGDPPDGRFDLVICTGVIHHNPDPGQCLRTLAAGLGESGVLELMVYNRFHRRETAAFQEALRLLSPGTAADPQARLADARALSASLCGSTAVENTLTAQLRNTENSPKESWADRWVNPCEHSYDVASLWQLAEKQGLTLEAPVVNPFDKVEGTLMWTLDGLDDRLHEGFLAGDDRTRWQIVNLLHHNASPKLWFYLRHGGDADRVTEADRNRRFLDSVPTRPTAVRRRYVHAGGGAYELDDETSPLAGWQPPAEVRPIWEQANGKRSGREILASLGLTADFTTVYRARTLLCSAEFPHLILQPAP